MAWKDIHQVLYVLLWQLFTGDLKALHLKTNLFAGEA